MIDITLDASTLIPTSGEKIPSMPQQEVSPAVAKKREAATLVMGGCLAAASSVCTTATAMAAIANCWNTRLRRLMPCSNSSTSHLSAKSCKLEACQLLPDKAMFGALVSSIAIMIAMIQSAIQSCP